MTNAKTDTSTKPDSKSVASCADEDCKGIVHANERADGTVLYSCNVCAKRHTPIPNEISDGKVVFAYAIPSLQRKRRHNDG